MAMNTNGEDAHFPVYLARWVPTVDVDVDLPTYIGSFEINRGG